MADQAKLKPRRIAPLLQVATHPKAREIGAAILAGRSVAKVAASFGLPVSAVSRYRREVVAPILRESTVGQAMSDGSFQTQRGLEVRNTVAAAVHDVDSSVKTVDSTVHEVDKPSDLSVGLVNGFVRKTGEEGSLRAAGGGRGMLNWWMNQLSQGVDWVKDKQDARGLASLATAGLRGARLTMEADGELDTAPTTNVAIVLMAPPADAAAASKVIDVQATKADD